MFSKSRLLALVLLGSAFAAVTAVDIIDDDDFDFDIDNTSNTKTDAINSAVVKVNQKSGPSPTERPNLSIAGTTVTGGEGELASRAEIPASVLRRTVPGRFADIVERAVSTYSGYTQEFDSTCTKGANCEDASIEGAGYLKYLLVSNATYSIKECLDACTAETKCVFANLYYEYNNPLLDFVFSEHSNLKCALYSDKHTAAEKTNKGHQALITGSNVLSYIQQSTGWTKIAVDAEPAVPYGYSKVDIPQDAANNAPGYMGFAFLSQYDVQACAELCNSRTADSVGGVCQYFNIWRAVDDAKNPITYTCSMYFLVADPATAVNTGNAVITVTQSRGYARTSILFDGGLESYSCRSAFCYVQSYASWIGKSIFFNTLTVYSSKYARTGHGVALLGSGTLTSAKRLATAQGKKYLIQIFVNNSFTVRRSKNVVTQIQWNGKDACEFKTSSKQGWTVYSCTVIAKGSDQFALDGGDSWWSSLRSVRLVDDMSVFAL